MIRMGPGPTNSEIHKRVCQLKIATCSHPSKMLQCEGNVFPLVEDINVDMIIKEIENEPVQHNSRESGTRDSYFRMSKKNVRGKTTDASIVLSSNIKTR